MGIEVGGELIIQTPECPLKVICSYLESQTV